MPAAGQYRATTKLSARTPQKRLQTAIWSSRTFLPPEVSNVRASTTDLDNLMQAIDINVIALTEVLVPRGHRVEMGKIDAPGIHYNLSGVGRITINGGAQISLRPHADHRATKHAVYHRGRRRNWPADAHLERSVGHVKVASFASQSRSERPEVVQICGYFTAPWGSP